MIHDMPQGSESFHSGRGSGGSGRGRMAAAVGDSGYLAESMAMEVAAVAEALGTSSQKEEGPNPGFSAPFSSLNQPPPPGVPAIPWLNPVSTPPTDLFFPQK